MQSDTALLEFLVTEGGRLSSNEGHGYIYWYGQVTNRTKIVEGRNFREALNAAYNGEKAL